VATGGVPLDVLLRTAAQLGLWEDRDDDVHARARNVQDELGHPGPPAFVPDGRIVLEHEDDAMRARLGGDDQLVKLSDDPDWPDVRRVDGDPTLFAD
jgi:hypothetical protein